MRAILLNPVENTAKEVNITGDFEEMYQLLNCDMIEVVQNVFISHNINVDLYIDEEAKLKKDLYISAKSIDGTMETIYNSILITAPYDYDNDKIGELDDFTIDKIYKSIITNAIDPTHNVRRRILVFTYPNYPYNRILQTCGLLLLQNPEEELYQIHNTLINHAIYQMSYDFQYIGRYDNKVVFKNGIVIIEVIFDSDLIIQSIFLCNDLEDLEYNWTRGEPIDRSKIYRILD